MNMQDAGKLLEVAIKHKLNTLMVSAPGFGKNGLLDTVCKKLKVRLITETVSVSDVPDYKGFPYPNVAENKAQFLLFGFLKELVEATETLVVHLADIGQAPPSIQAALMQIVWDRTVCGHKVSSNVVFIGSTNDRGHKAAVMGIIEPLKSRFSTIVHLEPTADDWINGFAINAGMPTDLIAFVKLFPEAIQKWQPSMEIINGSVPRTLEALGRWHLTNPPKSIRNEVYSGCVGAEMASKFIAFCDLKNELPNPEEVLKDPDKFPLPTKMEPLYLLMTAIAAKADDAKHHENIIKLVNRVPKELSVLTLALAMKRKAAIMKHPAFSKWLSEFTDFYLG